MEKVFIPVPSGTSGLPPGVSPYANPTSANAYKGALRGLFGGVLMGGTLGGLVGLTVSGLIGLALMAFPVAGLAMSGGIAAAITGGFTLVGMKYYKDLFELTGAVSGGVSAAFEKHDYREHQQFLALHKELDGLRSKNTQLEQQQSLMIRGMARIGLITPQEVEALNVARAHDQQVQQASTGTCPDHGPSCPGHAPTNSSNVVKPVVASTELLQHPITNYRDLPKEANPSKPFVFWDVVGIGALVGAFIGAAFFGAGHLIAEHVPGIFGAGLNIAPEIAGAATVLGGAIGGATYGVNRHYVRQWFFLTNALYEGDLRLINQQKGQEISNIIENCKERGQDDCPILPNEDLAPMLRRVANVPDTQIAQAQPEGMVRFPPTLQASV